MTKYDTIDIWSVGDNNDGMNVWVVMIRIRRITLTIAFHIPASGGISKTLKCVDFFFGAMGVCLMFVLDVNCVLNLFSSRTHTELFW